jgi:hypothetical protein
VTELKARMRGRGDTAQIQRAEQTLERLDAVESKLVGAIIMYIVDCDQRSKDALIPNLDVIDLFHRSHYFRSFPACSL